VHGGGFCFGGLNAHQNKETVSAAFFYQSVIGFGRGLRWKKQSRFKKAIRKVCKDLAH
jgi:hypothetical protein